MGRNRQTSSPLHVIELTGNSRQRGIQHGGKLRAAIEKAIEFYLEFFRRYLGADAREVRRRAEAYTEPTSQLSQLLIAEIEGIAEGARRRFDEILMLSARYEILYESVALGECSNLFVGPQRSSDGHTLLAQGWDWRPEVMDFRALLIARCDDLPDHVVVTECGQPGKYGFNYHGLGVVSAGLCCSDKTSLGKNLFVVLGRQMLAQTNLSDACRVLECSPPHATVNFLVADAKGDAADFEASPRRIAKLRLTPDQVYWHTNHCLQSDEPCTFENSLIRGKRWAEFTASPEKITDQAVKLWLADRTDGADSICKLPGPPNDPHADTATRLQTLCSIVMDLNTLTMWVSDGPSCENPYRQFRLRAKPSAALQK